MKQQEAALLENQVQTDKAIAEQSREITESIQQDKQQMAALSSSASRRRRKVRVSSAVDAERPL